MNVTGEVFNSSKFSLEKTKEPIKIRVFSFLSLRINVPQVSTPANNKVTIFPLFSCKKIFELLSRQLALIKSALLCSF